MIDSIRAAQRTRFFRWVDRRMPPSSIHALNQKNIFIFPARQGVIFPVVMASLWVLGTNYQNNLILALVFFMAGLFVLTIHHTFNNVSRLKITYLGHSETYAGQDLHVRLLIRNPRKQWAENIEFCWQNDIESERENQVFDFAPFSEKEISIPLFVNKRGAVSLPRMRVQSFYPLGIVRCWTWLNWNASALVYPKAINGVRQATAVVDDLGDGLHPVRGGDDFSGLKTYQKGDTPRNISWKTLAKGQGLFSKDFSQNLSQEIWLDLDTIQETTLERKLSVLCFLVNTYYVQDENYGLKLLSQHISPDQGHAHRTKCLAALARFE